jgi:TonB family protein
MKTNTIILILLSFAMMANAQDKYCDQQMVEKLSVISNATYLKDFVAYLPAGAGGAKYTMILSKNTTYRIVLQSSEKLPGISSLKIKDTNGTIKIIQQVNKNEPAIEDLEVYKTGPYIFNVESDGKEACTVFILSYVNSQETGPQQGSTSENKVYSAVDFNATFQGSDINSFKNYISTNMKITSEITNIPPAKPVYVEFVVTCNGEATNAIIARSSGNVIFDNQAVIAVLSSPKWEPAKIGNKNVAQKFVIPIVYSKVK